MIGVVVSVLTVAQAAAPSRCELHVWPTQAFGAIFHGATIGPGGPAANMYVNPTEDIRNRVRDILPESEQVRQFKALDLSKNPKFSNYQLVFHPAPKESKFANWLDKSTGVGSRETDSKSPCYAELHLVALTLYRTALYSQLQEIFVFRDFGNQDNAVRVVRDAGRSNPSGFHGRGEDPPESRAILTNAFRLAAEKTLNNKEVLKPL